MNYSIGFIDGRKNTLRQQGVFGPEKDMNEVAIMVQ